MYLENPRGISQNEMLIRPAHLHAFHYSKHILEMSAAASILFTEMLKTQSGNVCNCKHSVYRNAQTQFGNVCSCKHSVY